MDLSWLQSLIYGLISGLTEFFPVSVQAHQTMMLRLFGTADSGNLTGFMVRIAVILALYLNCRDHIEHLRREQRLLSVPARRRKRQPDPQKIMELRFMKSTIIPLLLGFLFYFQICDANRNLLMISVLYIINGIVLYYPMTIRSGNKDARSMSGLDSILLGICGAFGMVAGLSRIGLITSAAAIRGADREHGLNWAYLLSLPVLLVYLGFDAFALISGGLGSLGFKVAIGYALAALGAFLGASVSLRMMRTFSRKTGFAGFAYYCWGAALFTFIMFLSI